MKRQENEPEASLRYRFTANRCRPQDVPLREDDVEATQMTTMRRFHPAKRRP